jgi:hypothetical protein
MSTFTGSELEFLAGLNKSWWRLYWKELSRLRRVEARDTEGPPSVPAIGEGDPACPLWRNATDAAVADALPRRVELVAGNR